jgi:hypothetical protein
MLEIRKLELQGGATKKNLNLKRRRIPFPFQTIGEEEEEEEVINPLQLLHHQVHSIRFGFGWPNSWKGRAVNEHRFSTEKKTS